MNLINFKGGFAGRKFQLYVLIKEQQYRGVLALFQLCIRFMCKNFKFKNLYVFWQFYGKKVKVLCSVLQLSLFVTIKWHEQHFSKVKLARLLSSETSRMDTKWGWRDCSQETLAGLFPSETDTTVPKWRCHSCSKSRLAWLFPSDTGTAVPK